MVSGDGRLPEPWGVYLDESGDPGLHIEQGASTVYVLAAAMLATPSAAEETSAAVAALRAELGVRPDFHFHFVHLRHDWRVRFCEAVRACPFGARAVVMDKQRMLGRGMSGMTPADVHHLATRLLLDDLAASGGHIKLFVDGKAARRSVAAMATKLRRDQHSRGNDLAITLRCVPKESNNALVQLADMIAGAVARSYREEKVGHAECRQMLARRGLLVTEYPDG